MAAQLFRILSNKVPVGILRRLVNIWPPFFGAGIAVEDVAPDFRRIKVSLKFRWYNKNYVGTQFGGSMYMMTDPFYMLMLINNLGPDYVVWDKAASIDFKKPGRSDLTAEFNINDEFLATVRERTQNNEKYIFDLPVNITDASGETVATVIKTLYVRLKMKAPAP